jgi:hypothetical protein
MRIGSMIGDIGLSLIVRVTFNGFTGTPGRRDASSFHLFLCAYAGRMRHYRVEYNGFYGS